MVSYFPANVASAHRQYVFQTICCVKAAQRKRKTRSKITHKQNDRKGTERCREAGLSRATSAGPSLESSGRRSGENSRCSPQSAKNCVRSTLRTAESAWTNRWQCLNEPAERKKECKTRERRR